MDFSDELVLLALRVRMVEEKIIDLYPSDLIQSPVHLSIGQETVAVGVCAALDDRDMLFPNYRGHAFYLARKAPLNEFFAELMGRKTGISKGKAGSMHLAAPDYGVMGASAVVASTISHAVGAALAERIKGKSDRVFVAVFGDGATEQGAFFESLNFCSIHGLPVLFLCEDNSLAVHTSLDDRQSFSLERISNAFGIRFFNQEAGFDPVAVFETTSAALKHLRDGSGPALLRVKTMRYREHVGPGEDFDAGYRAERTVTQWKKQDPLLGDLSRLTDEIELIRDEIDQAVEFAIGSDFPGIEELLTDVL